MATPSYPDSLPGPKTFVLEPSAQVLVTDNDVGPKDFRRRSRQPGAFVDATFRFLESDYATFVTWWRSDLKFGHKWFLIRVPSAGGITQHVVRFAERYSSRLNGHRYWEVSAKLELRDRQFEPVVEDEFGAQVRVLLHMDNPSTPQVWPDVFGNVWSRSTIGSHILDLGIVSAPKWGDGALLMKTEDGTSSDYQLTAPSIIGDYSLGAGNKFTIEGWLWWTGHVDSRVNLFQVLNTSGAIVMAIEFNTTSQLRFRTQFASLDDRLVAPPLSQWVHLAMTYDGTTKYWFVNGALTGSAAVAVGSVKTVRSYAISGTASGNPAAPVAYMDDIRFTAGVCRYTSAFSVPTGPYPNP